MSADNRIIFSGMTILIDDHWVTDKAIIVEGSTITGIIPDSMINNHLPAKRYDYSRDYYLVPGFIDLHIHGTFGRDVMDASVESLLAISRALASEGVTGFLATTMTMPVDSIEAALRCIPDAQAKADAAAILGVHLEGPFISKDKMGAQAGDYAMLPNIELLRHWHKLCHEQIKLVTFAPELSGSDAFIAELKKLKIIASVGHTNASYDETMNAINHGAMQATHLFNAMTGIHHREPGATTALLLQQDLFTEVLADGIHLHPAILSLAYRMKTKDRLLLVTDAMRAKCLGDGCYDLGGQSVDVKGGRATLHDGTLAGSTLTTPQAIKTMADQSGASLLEAVQMATRNPARVMHLPRKGSIGLQMDADLVLLTPTLNVELTFREGRKIYPGLE